MKHCQNLFLILFFICLSANVNAQYILVDDTQSAQNLVQNTLINSPCANVSDFRIRSGNFSGAENSFGYFSSGSSGFPFADGIILSSGMVTSAIGPNNSVQSEGFTNWLGDNDLETALGVSGTVNATVLEFKFVPLTSKISFDYIFSSEQYLSNPSSNQCGFTDGFAFLLKEDIVGATYQNLAVVPNTNIPVSVNTVRGSGTICPDINPQYFDAFNGINHPTNFNGQTVTLKAQATVIPGKTYQIKLVIADQGNNLYDSAIFLKGGSFNVGVDLGNDKILANNNPLCIGEIITLDATQSGTNTYKWFANGIQIPNEFNPTYTITDNTNTSEVVYSVEVILGSASCIVTGNVKIQFTPKPVLNNAIIVNCDDNADGFSVFNLTKLDNFIRSATANIIPLTATNVVDYFTDSNCTIQINNPANYVNTTATQQIIYAKVANKFGCTAIAQVTLIVNNINRTQVFTICDSDNNQDGITAIDLDLQITANLIPSITSGLIVKYYKSITDAIAQNNSLVNNFTNTIVNQQVVFARITNGNDCLGIITITLNIDSFNKTAFQDETKYLCPSQIIKLEVPIGFSYVWSNGNVVDNFINITASGNYSVIATNANNCSVTKNFFVIPSEPAIINSIDVYDFNDNENTITVNYSGNGNYEFSLDSINFQSANVFTNIAIGEYIVTIRDVFGCQDTISSKIFVLDFPKFFTPNNDGFNDVWTIKNLNKNATINIYDRFGKFIYLINKNNNSWNGTFNEQQLPADDYWFSIQLDNNRIIKNHFSLKR